MTALDAVRGLPGGPATLADLATAHRRWDAPAVVVCRCRLAALLAGQPDPAAALAEIEACTCTD